MLCREALESALPLAERLDRANVVVQPVTGTPLDLLVQATRAGSKFAIQLGTVYQPSIADIEYVANSADDQSGVCAHDVALDQLVAMGAQGVKNHLVIVRTGVKPAIMALHDAVAKKMEEMPASSLLGLEVKIHDLPLPMKNPAIEGLVSKFDKVPLESPALKMKCPACDMEQLKELLQTGAKNFDSDVEQWIATKGESFFLQLWEDVFTTKNDNFDSFADAVNCRDEGLDRALAIFLMARKMEEDPIEGVSMGLPAFKSLIAQYRDQAASKITRALDEWSATVKRSTLIKSWKDNCVVVNECVYRPWIAAGGSNELLFGALVSGAGYLTTQQIDGNAADLQRAWNRQAGVKSAIENGARFNTMKQILLAEFKKSLDEIKEPGVVDVSAQARMTMIEDFKRELATVKESDCQDLYTVCLKLLCRSRFVNTQAEEFLLNMKQIACNNPTLDVREVATIATIEYIACWVAEQFRTSKAAA